jgi:outer membrane phospholipase A
MVSSNKIEQSEAKRMGARPHKNSGRGKMEKGDATWGNFTVDYKHVGKSFTLNKNVWSKAVTDAVKNGNDPALIIVIGEDNQKIRLAIVEMSILEQLVDGV